MTNRLPRPRLPLPRMVAALLSALALCAGLLLAPAPAALAVSQTVTNTAHLDFLLDTVTPPSTTGHTTYKQDSRPTLTMPWTYADARPGGTFARVGGGGPPDPVTGYYLQGAFNSDDVARAAVVYLRHWQQTGDRGSRTKAYELLRAVAYFQTTTGKNRGHVVLWMQPDGTLNPSAKPVELPNPSDSGPSYWQARTIWALGEGYAAFASDDPAFASFLQDRLQLSVGALNRHVLNAYGRHQVSDGRRVPAWLIVNGADVSAEAALGLSAYVAAAPHDRTARTALRQLLEGVAEMATSRTSWPYGAILPWAASRSLWHAWSSQMAGSLARGSAVLNRPDLLRPAVTEAVSFDPTLITANGPDNAWLPTPVDTTQIAYGIDSRVQNLLATADVAHLPGLRSLAAMDAAWFFGANRAGATMYDPATGVTFDGLAADGTVNRNSGAESTIHGLLTMLALDAHPGVRSQAVAWRTTPTRVGLTVLEAESATTNGTVVTPASAWTGESQYSGGAYLRLAPGQRATIALPTAAQKRVLEPVSWLPEEGKARSRWTTANGRDTLKHSVGAQGLSAVSGALLPLRLKPTAPARATRVAVTVSKRAVDLDAVIARPEVSRAVFTADKTTTELLTSIAGSRLAVARTDRGLAVAARYDRAGRLVGRSWLSGSDRVWVEAGGFTVVTG